MTDGLDGHGAAWVAARPVITFPGHEEEATTAVAVTADGRALVVTGGFGETTVRIWDVGAGEPAGWWRPGSDDAWAITTGVLDGRPVVVTGGYGGVIEVRDPAGGRLIRAIEVKGHPGITDIDDLAEDLWYPGGIHVNALATAVLDGQPVVIFTVHTDDSGTGVCQDFPVAGIHDLATGRQTGEIATGHSGAVHLATTVLDGRPVLITASSADPAVRVWDLTTGGRLGAGLTGNTAGVTVVTTALLDDGPVVVTGGYDGTVRRWDLRTGLPLGKPLTGRSPRWVQDLAVVEAHGRPIVAALMDENTVHLWDLTTGEPAADPITASGVGALAATTAGGRPVAVTVMADTTVQVWDLAARLRA
ncbi:WD40 repeat domain-containing protein [Streptosporangium carneum]|nr:WD40 repeat domain-containing protein [Streptosporangium carneum]